MRLRSSERVDPPSPPVLWNVCMYVCEGGGAPHVRVQQGPRVRGAGYNNYDPYKPRRSFLTFRSDDGVLAIIETEGRLGRRGSENATPGEASQAANPPQAALERKNRS